MYILGINPFLVLWSGLFVVYKNTQFIAVGTDFTKVPGMLIVLSYYATVFSVVGLAIKFGYTIGTRVTSPQYLVHKQV